MKKKLFSLRSTLRFTHFTRKHYALFSTLGKVVIIGVLSVSTLKHAKASGISVREDMARDTLVNAREDLGEVVVTGSHVPLWLGRVPQMVELVTQEDIAHGASTTSVNDVLKNVIGIDVRQRGAYGVQTDISLHGGNFDELTFLVNGVNFSSPHTGHLSADFPLSTDDIQRIEILESPAAKTYGAGAFNGIINLITRQGTKFITANLSAGSYGYLNAGGNISTVGRHFSNFVSLGYSRSDGATPNSAFSSLRLFWQGKAYWRQHSLSAQASYSYKPYEANTFYGAASPDQWESNERISAALSGDIVVGKVHITPQVYWNRWYDHYQWHRYDPAGENFHRVTATAERLSAWAETILGRTAVGVELRQERIWSTSLGKEREPKDYLHTRGRDRNDSIYYTHHDGRNITSIFLEHDVLLGPASISLGLNAIHTPLDGWNVCPGANLSYRPADIVTLYASWNMAMRMPTFTDLYYSGANIEGNSDLKSEHTMDFQLGLRLHHSLLLAELQLFYSHKKNMIDWVTSPDFGDDIFHSVNFKTNSLGAEVNLSLLPQALFGEAFPLNEVSVKYAFIRQKSYYGVSVLESKYAMEYLRNKLILSCNGHIWKDLSFSLSWRFNDRVGSSNPDYALLDGKISWDKRLYSLFFEANNILNKRYYDYVSIPQPRFTFVAGVKLHL